MKSLRTFPLTAFEAGIMNVQPQHRRFYNKYRVNQALTNRDYGRTKLWYVEVTLEKPEKTLKRTLFWVSGY